jgi:acyl-CoA thioesterase
LINESVEVLPLSHNDFPVAAVNVVNIVDGIDYERAQVRTLSNGTFIGFNKYAFHQEKVIDQHIFKIPEQLSSKVFVSDQLKELVETNRLKGFTFTEVWDSQPPIYKPIESYQDDAVISSVEYSFAEAMNIVDEGQWAIICETYKWQKNKEGKVLLGDKLPDGSYAWMEPVYIPIPMTEMKWRIAYRSDL